MPDFNNVHLSDYNAVEIQDLFYAVLGDIVSMSETSVVTCRLPQRGAFLEAHYHILD